MSPADAMRSELNTLRAERDELLKALRACAEALTDGTHPQDQIDAAFKLAMQAIQNAEGK